MRCTRDGWLLLLCLSQVAAVLIFTSGFFSKRVPSFGARNSGQDMDDPLQGCSDSLLKRTVQEERVTKIVVVLIDAWREQFLYSRKAMQFLRQITLDGQAVAFTARVQTPTVTMPRIKAVTAGIVPSFADVIMNFASDSISNDNIIDQFKGKGYRCTFCGDETWLRLFPGRFDNHSEGTTSFYVNDYKEVDDNVTRCMNARLEDGALETWDLMILHYLGLDHIGHSLGGTHSELDNKLAEMDSVVEKLYQKLHKMYPTNFSVIIFGDHGMTEAGSHGGSSELETRVPVVHVDGRKRHTAKDVRPVASIEQVDIVPTLAFLFNVPIPNENLGVTLLSHIATDHSNISILLSLLRSAEQFQKLSATSDKLNSCVHLLRNSVREYCGKNSNSSSNVEDLISECLVTLREIQSQLIRLETVFDDVQIMVSIILSFTVSLICICMTYFTYSRNFNSDFQHGPLLACLAVLMQILHSLALFASSLVEEEHDLQYFFFASCLFVMFLEELHALLNNPQIKNSRNHSESRRKSCKMITILFLLVIHRFCSGYVESTRRRWIMEKDIHINRSDLSSSYYEIMTSAGNSVDIPDFGIMLKEWAVLRFICGVLSLVVIGMGLFIFQDKKRKYSRIVLFLTSAMLLGIFLRHYSPYEQISFYTTFLSNVSLLLLQRDLFLSLMLWVIFIMRTYYLPLAALQLLLGCGIALLDAQPFVLVFAIYSSFFYSGNSNSLSTVDIAVGFVGVESYQPVRIALQMLLNTYSGPLLVIFGWWHFLSRRKLTDSSLLSLKLNAVLCWACSVIHLNMSLCLLSLFIQRYHLFVWSVFAPKFLYEFAHLLVLTVIIHVVGIYGKLCWMTLPLPVS